MKLGIKLLFSLAVPAGLWGCLHAVSNSGAAEYGVCSQLDNVASAVCIDTFAGAVLARERSPEVEALARMIAEGAQRYAGFFGSPPRYLVIHGIDRDAVQPAIAAARIAVVQFSTPLEHLVESRRAAARRSAEARLKLQNLSPEQYEAALNAELAKVGDLSEADLAQLRKTAAHEIGHQWLIAQFWPEHEESGREYGGPAPDWLDELAATVAEPAESWEDRRAAIARLDAMPLAEYLQQDHPLAATIGVPAEQVPAVIAAMPGGPAALGPRVVTYYGQTRAFADFLMQRSDSGTPGRIAQAMADGMTLEAWLAREGQQHGLGSSVGELQMLWENWLREVRGGESKPGMSP